MKHLKEWLERLRQRAQRSLNSAHYGQQEALEVLAICDEHSDWLQLSRHWNGFIREIAVRVLCEAPSPQALVALVERLNDWVPQVRGLAEQGVQPYLQPSQADALLHALDPLLALANKGRSDHEAILSKLADALTQPELQAVLEQALKGRQGKAPRFLFSLLLKNGADNLQATLQLGMKHPEVSLRRMALTASRQLPLPQARIFLRQGYESPSAQIRVIALREWLARDEEEPAQIQALLRQGLLDPAPAPRCLAHWAATRHGMNCSEVLVQRLAKLPSDKRSWLGLIGLAKELAEPQALSALEIALQHQTPTIRSGALEAIAAIVPDDVAPTLLSALDDPSIKVVRTATQLLQKQHLRATDEQLSSAIAQTLEAGRNWKLITLAALTPLWTHLQQLLHGLSNESDPAQQEQLLAALKKWRQRRRRAYALQATSQQQSALLAELAALMNSGKLPTSDPIQWLD